MIHQLRFHGAASSDSKEQGRKKKNPHKLEMSSLFKSSNQ